MPLDVVRFTGEDGRERDEEDAIKGFVVSKALVNGLDFIGPREERFGGDEASETLFRPEIIDGVRGVFASDLDRSREGVFGCPYIEEDVKRQSKISLGKMVQSQKHNRVCREAQGVHFQLRVR